MYCKTISILEQAKFAYSPLGKAFEKQTEKQVDAIKFLNSSNKLKQIEGIFPQNLMNDLIRAKLNEIVELQDNKSFLNNLGLLFSTREKVLNRFKSKVSPIKNLDKITTRELTEPATELEVAKEPTKATKCKNKTQNIFFNIA